MHKRNKQGVSRPPVNFKEKGLHTFHKTGVFEETVRGTTVGFFVGWRYRWTNGRARNIRRGLYFNTAQAATEFRDSLEPNPARDNVPLQTQIA